MKFKEQLAKRIRDLCEEHQLSISALARRSHTSPHTIRRLLSPDSSYEPQLITLFKLCRGFGISMQEFFRNDRFGK